MARRRRQTVGYRYFAGMHLVFCHGPIDRVNEYYIDEDRKTLASGASGNARITVNRPNLFGGENSQGGVRGTFDQLMGGPAQTQNSYLLAQLGALVPAFRGVVSAVLNQMYLGTSPYLKRIGINATRIHTTGRNGDLQWYDEKAAIFQRVFEGRRSPITFGFLAVGEGVLLPSTFPELNSAEGGANFTQTLGVGAFQYEEFSSSADFPVQSATISFDSSWTLELRAHNENSDAGIGNTYSIKIEFLDVSGGVLFVVRSSSSVEGQCRCFYGPSESELTTAGFEAGVFQYTYGELTFTPTSIIFTKGVTSPFAGTLDWSAGFDVLACSHIRVTNGPSSFRFSSQPAGYESGGWVKVLSRGTNPNAIVYDMNPAHIIRECLTNSDWGMGYAEADIDDDAFRYAADVLYDEGMGISLLWDTSQSIEDFVGLICKHIDASIFVDRAAGLFVLKLIRDDYDIDDLIELGVSNVLSVADFNKPAFGELVNSVTVTYWDGLVRGNATITVSDIALAAAQSAVVSGAISYPGFTLGSTATRVAQRDLIALSSPRVSCTVIANRIAKGLKPGDCFRLTWPDLEIDDLVMRVIGIAFGDGKSNQVRISCTEDVFATPNTAVIADPPEPFDPAVDSPEPATLRVVGEMPYWEAAQRYDQINVDDKLIANPDVGFVIAAAARPTTNAINAGLWTNPGSGYVEATDPLDFCPYGFLNGDIDRMVDELPISGATEVTSEIIGTWLLCDDEIMQVVDWDEGYLILTVRRGCLDTVPVTHDDGAVVLFVGAFSETDDLEYNSGESVAIKILPNTPTDSLELADAPEDIVMLAHRGIRPYPPADVRFNGDYWPVNVLAGDLELTWVERNRTTQTGATMVGWYDAAVASEPGVLYAVQVLDELDQIIYESLEIVGSSHTVPGESLTSNITVRIWSRRDVTSAGGYESWQVVEHALTLGEALITESAELMLTESDDEILT